MAVKKTKSYDSKRRRETFLEKQAGAFENLSKKISALGEEALLDEFEMAALIGKSVQWVRSQRINGETNAGTIPYLKIGAAVRYRLRDIKAAV
jgi:hypothetical protein